MKAFPLILLAIAAAGCSKSAPTPGKTTTIEDACNAGADGDPVRVSGFLGYERGLLSFCSTYGGHKTCDLALYTKAKPADWDPMRPATEPEPASVKLSVPVGKDTGEMTELPDKFKASDVVLHLPNGATTTDGQKVTIDGKLSVIPNDPSTPNAKKQCFVNVTWATAS